MNLGQIDSIFLSVQVKIHRFAGPWVVDECAKHLVQIQILESISQHVNFIIGVCKAVTIIRR